MSYMVTCSFDLANASREDYQNAYADLAAIGLRRKLKGDSQGAGQPASEVALPTTTTAGVFNGQSSAGVANDLMARIKQAFAARRFKAEVFVVVGENWAWLHHNDR